MKSKAIEFTKAQEADAYKLMALLVRHHRSSIGEVNHTSLAEEVAGIMDAYEDRRDYRPIERLFEIAAEFESF